MLKVLIIGCGNIAGGFDAARPSDALPYSHAGAYTRHGGFSIAACIEPDAARREAFMARWQVAQGYACLQELNGDRDFDVVSICSPTTFHEADVAAALALKPRLVFCEKPITPSAAQSRALVSCCAAAKVPLVVNYTRRWDASLQRLAEELRSGVWGAVRSASGTYTKGVLNNGSHMVDLLQLLLGPLTAKAAGTPVNDMWAEDPSIPALLYADHGVSVMLNCGHAGDYALFEMQLVTAKGVIQMQDSGLGWRIRRVIDSRHYPGYRVLEAGQTEAGAMPGAILAAVSEIHAALTQGSHNFSSTGDNALAAQEVCESIRALAGLDKANT